MTTLYIGQERAYRDELSIARAESARAAVTAPRAQTLEWTPKLVFRVTWDAEDHFTTDDVVLRKWVTQHPDSAVQVLSVAS